MVTASCRLFARHVAQHPTASTSSESVSTTFGMLWSSGGIAGQNRWKNRNISTNSRSLQFALISKSIICAMCGGIAVRRSVPVAKKRANSRRVRNSVACNNWRVYIIGRRKPKGWFSNEAKSRCAYARSDDDGSDDGWNDAGNVSWFCRKTETTVSTVWHPAPA